MTVVDVRVAGAAAVADADVGSDRGSIGAPAADSPVPPALVTVRVAASLRELLASSGGVVDAAAVDGTETRSLLGVASAGFTTAGDALALGRTADGGGATAVSVTEQTGGDTGPVANRCDGGSLGSLATAMAIVCSIVGTSSGLDSTTAPTACAKWAWSL